MKMLKHQDLQHYFLSSFLLETLMRRGDLHCIIYSRVLTKIFLEYQEMMKPCYHIAEGA